jgi:hypothetical protein
MTLNKTFTMKKKLHKPIIWIFLITAMVSYGNIHAQELSTLLNVASIQNQPSNVIQDRDSNSHKTPLRTIVVQIEKEFNVNFNYDDEVIHNLYLNEDFKWNKQEKLDDVLNKLFKKFELQYEKLKSDNYLIFKSNNGESSLTTAKKPESENNTRSFFESIIGKKYKVYENSAVLAKTVSGVITDDAGGPLPGVNVIEKNTTNGTVTDIEGKYSLSVQDDNSILVFSFIGFVSEEVVVGNRSTINLAMTPDIQTLGEVVVVGYGTQQRRDLTGSFHR